MKNHHLFHCIYCTIIIKIKYGLPQATPALLYNLILIWQTDIFSKFLKKDFCVHTFYQLLINIFRHNNF